LLRLDEPACRKWITDRVSQVISDEGIDFYRQDFNIDPLYYWRGADADDRLGMTEIRHLEGYFKHWDELVRRHPNLLIDSCASGGRRNDIDTLKRAVPILRSDWTGDPANTAFDPQDEQNHVYGISFWMPWHGSGFMTVDPYLVRSLMGPIVGIGVDTRRTDLDYKLLMKLYREIRAVQRDCLGDYLPLTPYAKGPDAWCAWQFDRPELGQGIVQAFRRKSCASETITLKLGNLDPDATYAWRDLDGDAPREIAGKALLDGIAITSAKRPAALSFTYRRIDRSRHD
jgi:alpha-galactosidase